MSLNEKTTEEEDADALLDRLMDSDEESGGYKLSWQCYDGRVIQLSPRQHRFVTEYMIDNNAVAAAKRAGYKQVHGTHNNPIYKKPVWQAIQDEVAHMLIANKVTATRTMARLGQIAFASDTRLAEYVKMGVKVSLKDQISALEVLGKMQGMFAEHNKREVMVSLSDYIKQSYEIRPRDTQALPVVVRDADIVEHGGGVDVEC
jgi:hypothetical protein